MDNMNNQCYAKTNDQIWKNLFKDLVLLIFEMLPLNKYIQLQEICKDSYHGFVAKSSFHLFPLLAPNIKHIGVLGFDTTNNTWKFHPVFLPKNVISSQCESMSNWIGQAIAFKDLICFYKMNYNNNTMYDMYAYQMHSNEMIALPSPIETIDPKISILGIYVDMSTRISSFKIIYGSDVGTQIYDSNMKSWTMLTSCHLPSCLKSGCYIVCCTHNKRYMYIKIQHRQMSILVFDMEMRNWSTLQPPLTRWCTLWIWKEDLFCLAIKSTTSNVEKNTIFTIYKLVDRKKHIWKEYDCMPSDWYSINLNLWEKMMNIVYANLIGN